MLGSLPTLPGIPRRIFLTVFAALLGPILLACPPAAVARIIQSADRASYVLFAPGSQGSKMSGSTDDLRRAKALRAGREGLLYVRDGGAAYVIRDAATLRQADTIFEPQVALGAQQAGLGSRQAAFGKRQAELGAKQARLGLQQVDASPTRARELGSQQEALGRQQDALGRQQEALGRQQDALGRQHPGLAREAEAKFRALLADAVQRGLAHRVE